jgi:hypothetical protein
MYLLSKLRYAPQVFPLPTSHAQQLTTAIICFIWHGDIFRVPTSTLYRMAEDGGLELLAYTQNVQHYTCYGNNSNKNLRYLYGGVVRSLEQIHTDCELHMSLALSYLRPFFLEWAYIGKRLEDDTPRALKRKVCGALSVHSSKSTTTTPIRIHQRHPHKDWRAIWRNVSMAHLQDTATSSAHAQV